MHKVKISLKQNKFVQKNNSLIVNKGNTKNGISLFESKH